MGCSGRCEMTCPEEPRDSDDFDTQLVEWDPEDDYELEEIGVVFG